MTGNMEPIRFSRIHRPVAVLFAQQVEVVQAGRSFDKLRSQGFAIAWSLWV